MERSEKKTSALQVRSERKMRKSNHSLAAYPFKDRTRETLVMDIIMKYANMSIYDRFKDPTEILYVFLLRRAGGMSLLISFRRLKEQPVSLVLLVSQVWAPIRPESRALLLQALAPFSEE